MTPHPNAMIHWDEIRCQRGHKHHASLRTTVALGGVTGYGDYAPIPKRFARQFEMAVWDPLTHPVDGGPYCPAHDAVSATILSHHVWEPRETTIALHVMEGADRTSAVIDMGAQLGWYTLLAASCGLPVLAYEADAENQRLLLSSLDANDWRSLVQLVPWRINESTPELYLPDVRIALAKIDLEGAEDQAIRMLWPSIEAGLVDHLIVEVSPVFADYYPELVVRLVDAGYRAFTLPPKQRPPVSLLDLCALEPYRIDTLARDALAKWVADCHQEDVFFVREEMAW